MKPGKQKQHSPPASAPGPWDRLSPHYDRQRWLERASVQLLVDLAAPAEHERLLDVATGTGAVLRALAARPTHPHDVVAVDSSEAMLARVPPLPPGWKLEQGDARVLRYPEGTFDLVTASYLLHLLEDTERAIALKEFHRVLGPGGRLAVLTPVIPTRGPLRLIALGLDRLARTAPARLGGLRALDPRTDLEAAGFEVIEAEQSARGYIAICVLARKSSSSADVQ